VEEIARAATVGAGGRRSRNRRGGLKLLPQHCVILSQAFNGCLPFSRSAIRAA